MFTFLYQAHKRLWCMLCAIAHGGFEEVHAGPKDHCGQRPGGNASTRRAGQRSPRQLEQRGTAVGSSWPVQKPQMLGKNIGETTRINSCNITNYVQEDVSPNTWIRVTNQSKQLCQQAWLWSHWAPSKYAWCLYWPVITTSKMFVGKPLFVHVLWHSNHVM